MYSSLILIFRRALVLILVLVIGITNFATPASASELFMERDPYPVELIKKVIDTSVLFLTPPAICLAADALASGFFPPAAGLAPFCAALAIPTGTLSAGSSIVSEVIHTVN